MAEHDALAERLAAAGCVAAGEEADELRAAAGADTELLERLVARRETGEPLAWVAGSTVFAGWRIVVHPGVYVPRWETEPLARRAAHLLAPRGAAADLCTGSGAVAAVLGRARPAARVVATDVDPAACRNAAANGVEVYCGSFAEPLPKELRGQLDVVTAVVPYVPTEELAYLPRDVQAYEPRAALDGGPGGLVLLRQAVRAASTWLRTGGRLLLELGGDQADALADDAAAAGFAPWQRSYDDDGDLRHVEATLGPPPGEPADLAAPAG